MALHLGLRRRAALARQEVAEEVADVARRSPRRRASSSTRERVHTPFRARPPSRRTGSSARRGPARSRACGSSRRPPRISPPWSVSPPPRRAPPRARSAHHLACASSLPWLLGACSLSWAPLRRTLFRCEGAALCARIQKLPESACLVGYNELNYLWLLCGSSVTFRASSPTPLRRFGNQGHDATNARGATP